MTESLTLLDHLEELRRRILRCLLLIALFCPVMWFASAPLIDFFKFHFCPPEIRQLYYTAPMELFFLRLKLSFFLALIPALPYVAWNVWAFVAPGLYRSERRTVLGMSAFSVFLFLGGAAFALFCIFPLMMRYSVAMGSEQIQPLLSVGSVIGMAVFLMLGFGISFQLPLLAAGLVRCGIVEYDTLRKARPYIVVAIFIIAGILTPPDIISQISMALPTLLLFEIVMFFLTRTAKREQSVKKS